MTTLRHRGIAVAAAALGGLRTERWLGRFARGEGIAFTLHRVCADEPQGFAPNRALQVTPAFLRLLIQETRRAGFEFTSIDDALGRMCGTRPSGRPFAVLTFDDGYRDNIDIAAPILKAEGVPWALFVVPDFLEGRGRLWWLELQEIVRLTDQIRIDIEGKHFVGDCRQPAAKERVFATLVKRCSELSDVARIGLLDQLEERFGCVNQGMVRKTCLTWHELSEAASDPDLTIGSHTTSHTILPCCTQDDAERQIAGSKSALETRIGRPIRHLAYPHGRAVMERDARFAKLAGYAAAWTTRGAHLTTSWQRSAPFSLPRVSVNGLHANGAMLRAVLSGVPFLAQRAPIGCS